MRCDLTTEKPMRPRVFNSVAENVVCTIIGIEVVKAAVKSSTGSARRFEAGLCDAVVQLQKLKVDHVSHGCVDLVRLEFELTRRADLYVVGVVTLDRFGTGFTRLRQRQQ